MSLDIPERTRETLPAEESRPGEWLLIVDRRSAGDRRDCHRPGPVRLCGQQRRLRRRGPVVLESHAVDVVISDWKMPGMDGVELISRIKDRDPAIICVLMTGYAPRKP